MDDRYWYVFGQKKGNALRRITPPPTSAPKNRDHPLNTDHRARPTLPEQPINRRNRRRQTDRSPSRIYSPTPTSLCVGRF